MVAPVIIVTGVSRGIGRAVAEELQARGAAVVGAARNVVDVPATAGLLPVAADVTQETGRKAIVEAALARYGRLDGLVNNAGSVFRRASLDTALADFRQMLEVNLLAAFALCCAAYPHLKASPVPSPSWPCPIPITSAANSWPWTAATWRRACQVESAAGFRRTWADYCIRRPNLTGLRDEKGASDGDLDA
jgi:NAD(P)-dependent dehydrogenase (short-subunit alcohol dehydrogenase family)